MTMHFGTNAVLSDADVDFVSDLIKEAGRLAVEMRGGISVKQKSGPRDVVTDADLALSKLIVESLKRRFPKDAVVSEEDTAATAGVVSPRTWYVDPIDGTEYYIASGGMYSVMI